MVETHSSSGMPPEIMVQRILLVRVERMFAFTPLPRPSASTSVRSSSPPPASSTLSPQRVSPCLFMLMEPVSIHRSFMGHRIL